MSENLRRHYGVEHWATDQRLAGEPRGDSPGIMGWIVFAVVVLLVISLITSFWFISLPVGAFLSYRAWNNFEAGHGGRGFVMAAGAAFLILTGLGQLISAAS